MHKLTTTAAAPTCAASIASKIRTLTITMLIVIAAALPASVFAADINNVNRAAAMEKQRNLNKANLAKVQIRHFDRKTRSPYALKLDALPPSPRRGAEPDALGSLRTAYRTRKDDPDLPSLDD